MTTPNAAYKDVNHNGKTLRFATPNDISAWRVDTMFTKEPDTIRWLEGLGPDDVLFDIGANMGIYTIFAAAVSGCRVRAFEPESQNFQLLMQNIVLNELSDRTVAYPIAVYSENKLGVLYIGDFQPAQAIHSFDQNVDAFRRPTDHQLTQGVPSYLVDSIVAERDMPFPTHIKIDVDGLEPEVVAGMAETLRNPALRSILIEINTNVEEHRDIVGQLQGAGFGFDPGQVETSMRTSGRFAGLANHIFHRKA